jgi:hypothetical protein
MAKKKQTLADYVEAAERREAPRAQARAAGRRTWRSLWLGLIVITVVCAAGALVYLKFKRLI